MAQESSISREKARDILTSLDRADEWDRLTDYYLVTNDDGEHLWRGGDDEPLATNHDTTSWASPGFPACAGA